MKLFKLYIKYFLVVSLIYTLLMVGLDLITNREITFSSIVIRILIFGVAMTLVLVTFHWYQVRNIAKQYGLKTPDYEVEQKRVFHSDNSPEQIYSTLKNRPIYRKVTFQEENKKIEIRTGFSGKSWGDKIIINSEKENGNYLYKVQSKPTSFLTIIDFGQNLENVLKIEHYAKLTA